jgi:uncharacterized protein with ParB-like and HNH nuclease domain
MITIEPWPISAFLQNDRDGALVISPDYQRREVWALKDQMRLIDSIARQVPAGAVTLYEDDSPGYKRYEVIDGKQRLTAILDYVGGEFAIRPELISEIADEEDFTELDSVLAEAIYNKTWDELEKPQRVQLTQYKFPVFIVSGPRASAVQAFTRMNSNLYALKPQEIRNAVFAKTTFLETVIAFNENLSVGKGKPFFVALDLMTTTDWKRMQDLQLASELLLLLIDGPQNRRATAARRASSPRQPRLGPQQGLLRSAPPL